MRPGRPAHPAGGGQRAQLGDRLRAAGRRGLKLDWAENGRICVEMLLAAPEGYYDAMLMDIRMPVMGDTRPPMTGIRSLNRTDRNIPIIAMTADAFAEDVKHSLDCGTSGALFMVCLL